MDRRREAKGTALTALPGDAGRRPIQTADPSPDAPAQSSAGDPWALLVAQIQSGIDVERNLERLYAHFHPRLIHYLSRRGLNPERCEDLTQDVFVRVLRNIGTFQHRSWFARWLFEIAHNLFLNDLYRVRAREKPLEEEPELAAGDRRVAASTPSAEGPPSPYEGAALHEQTTALRKALRTLPPQMRRCLLLRLYQGLKYREIGDVLGISIDNVKAQLGQAKSRLRRMLTEGFEILDRLRDDVSQADPGSETDE